MRIDTVFRKHTRQAIGAYYILLLFGTSWIYPYISALLHWHWGDLKVVPLPVKQHRNIWATVSHDFIWNSYHKHNKTHYNHTMFISYGIDSKSLLNVTICTILGLTA